MSILPHAQKTTIYGGTFISSSSSMIYDQEQHALEELKRHSTGRAFHDSGDTYNAPRCLPKTREAVFREIEDWLREGSTAKPILWVYGPAGAGKSAIARSVAERTETMGCLLVASFFFNRSDGERNNTARLIPTIAYQMISSIPSTRKFILKAIRHHPRVFSLNVRSQIGMLLAGPLLSANISGSQSNPRLLLIDGLDECLKEEERMEFLHVMTEAISKFSFPLIIFCISRPESDIRDAFNNLHLHALSTRIVLDDRFDPYSDIKKFLIHGFKEVKRSHHLREHIPSNWPSTGDLKKLLMKASGQFIYAATVMKQVALRNRIPTEQLKTILGIGGKSHASPFKELDALYLQILSSIPVDDRSIVIRILGLICSPKANTTSGNISHPEPREVDIIFNLCPGQTHLYLQDLHSLIDVRSSRDGMKPFHASLGDFLTDRLRSGIYYVEPTMLEADTLLLTLRRNSFRIQSGTDPIHFNWDAKAKLLTDELHGYSLTFPWADILPEGGIRECIRLYQHAARGKKLEWVLHALDVYDF